MVQAGKLRRVSPEGRLDGSLTAQNENFASWEISPTSGEGI